MQVLKQTEKYEERLYYKGKPIASGTACCIHLSSVVGSFQTSDHLERLVSPAAKWASTTVDSILYSTATMTGFKVSRSQVHSYHCGHLDLCQGHQS